MSPETRVEFARALLKEALSAIQTGSLDVAERKARYAEVQLRYANNAMNPAGVRIDGERE